MLILKPKTAEIFGILPRSHELYDIKLLYMYVYCLPCQVLMYTCISLTFKQNKRRMCSSFLWFPFVEMLCTICKCFWLSIFLCSKISGTICVCWIYISQFTLRSPYESSKTLNVYIYKDVSARTNVFSLQFPCTCISNIVHIRHKKHSYSEVPGTKEFDLSYTNLYLIRFISFAILDKMNETEFALSVNSLVTCMFVIWVHVIVFY